MERISCPDILIVSNVRFIQRCKPTIKRLNLFAFCKKQILNKIYYEQSLTFSFHNSCKILMRFKRLSTIKITSPTNATSDEFHRSNLEISQFYSVNFMRIVLKNQYNNIMMENSRFLQVFNWNKILLILKHCCQNYHRLVKKLFV